MAERIGRPMSGPVSLPDLELVRARAAQGAIALLAGRNNQLLEQQSVVVGAGTTAVVIGPSSVFKPVDPQGNTDIDVDVVGVGGIGLTSATLLVQFSDDGGATWTTAVSVPIPGTNAAGGLAAATVMGVGALFRFVNTTFLPGGREFRAEVSAVGGSFTTTVNQGAMLVQEA